MVIETNKGNFGSYTDILKDMECLNYDQITIKKTVDCIGTDYSIVTVEVTRDQIMAAVKDTDKVFADLDMQHHVKRR